MLTQKDDDVFYAIKTRNVSKHNLGEILLVDETYCNKYDWNMICYTFEQNINSNTRAIQPAK